MSYQHLIWLYRYLWIVPHVLLLAVAVVMFRRKLHKQYPIFFSYLLFEFFLFCVLFTMIRLKVPLGLYLKTDFVERIGDAILCFGIIQELFAAALTNVGPLQKDMGRILRWVTLALIALGLGFIWVLCYNRFNPGRFSEYWIIGALRGAQCALLFLVLLWHRFLGVRMPVLSFGIGLGLGLVAAVDLLAVALKTFFVVGNGTTIDLVNMATYHVAVLFWLYFAFARKNVVLDPPVPLGQLRQYAVDMERAARRFQHSRPRRDAHKLTPIDLEAFATLTDPEEERSLKINLSRAEFRIAQRFRVRAIKAYMSAFSDNASVLFAAGQAARDHSDEQVAAGAREIMQSAMRLKIWCLLTTIRLNAALVFPGLVSPSCGIADPYRAVTSLATKLPGRAIA
jgi:hypothetical protein